MTPLLPELEELLIRTAREQADTTPEPQRRWRRPRTGLAIALGAVLATGVAAAATQLDFSRQLPSPRQAETFKPQPGSVRIDAMASEPTGGPPWQLRTWLMPDGENLCAQAGRLRGETFGLLFPWGHFARLYFGDNSGPDCAPGAVTMMRLVEDPTSTRPALWRTVVWGVLTRPPIRDAAGRLLVAAGDGTTQAVRREDVRVRIDAGGDTREIAVGERGGWLAVMDGDVRRDELTVTLLLPRGSRTLESPPRASKLLVGSNESEVIMPDPYGATPWALRSWQTTDGRTCLERGRAVEDEVGSLSDIGTFIEARRTTGSNCTTAPTGASLSAAVATAPVKDHDSASRSAGYVFVYGVTGDDIVELTATIGERRLPLARSDDRDSFLVAAKVQLVEPYARDIEDRLPAPIRVSARSAGGETVTVRPGVGLSGP